MFEVPILNTRLLLFALMLRLAAPGPLMFTFLVTNNSPLVRLIVAGRPNAKVIVSLLPAAAIAARSVPCPVSAVLVTTIVAALIAEKPVQNVAAMVIRTARGLLN